MKKLKFALVCLTALALAFSCKPEDGPGKPTVVDGPEAIVIVPGLEKVTLYGTLADDNKVTKVSVSWGEGADNSVSFEVNPAADKAISKVIELDEGDYTFKVFTYDTDGNSSDEAVTATGKSYGDTYIATLANRGVSAKEQNGDGNIVITWEASAATCYKTVVTYSKTGETAPETVDVAAGDATTTLVDPASGTFSVKSYFFPEMKFYDPAQRPAGLPANLPLDEFSPAEASSLTVSPFVIDVTSLYLVNAGVMGSSTDPIKPETPIQPDTDLRDGDWSVPQGWSITDNVRNQQGDTVGGWKNDSYDNGTPLVHFESQGWSGPGYENGKLWQTVTLPAGTYRFSTYYFRGNVQNCVIDLVADNGAALPDNSAAADGLAALRLTSDMQGSERFVEFTLTEEKQISLGLVISINSAEQYIQFTYFKLGKIVVTE